MLAISISVPLAFFASAYLCSTTAVFDATTVTTTTTADNLFNKFTLNELLDERFDPNTVDANGNSPLHKASQLGMFELCNSFIEKGTNVAGENNAKEMPIHLASRIDNLEIVELLIQRGSPISPENAFGITPLSYALASESSYRTAHFLINNEAMVDSHVVQSAFNTRNEEIILAVLDHWRGEIGVTFDGGLTFLHLAAMTDCCVPEILSKCVDIDAADNEGFTALHYAAKYNSVKATNLLLDSGAKTDLTCSFHSFTSISLAIHCKSAAVINVMMDRGIVDLQADHDGLPLFEHVIFGSILSDDASFIKLFEILKVLSSPDLKCDISDFVQSVNQLPNFSIKDIFEKHLTDKDVNEVVSSFEEVVQKE